MQGPPISRAEQDRSDVDAWPWRCLGCGATIFHDGEHCRDCASALRYPEETRRSPAAEGFVDWMQAEPFSDYVVKVTAVAGLEVTLTALWLKLLTGPAVVPGHVVPFPL